MEPTALKPLGQDLLDESIKFWILFTNYCKSKIQGDIEQREKVRRQIVTNFFDDIEYDEDVVEEQVTLKKYLDNMLYLPDVVKEKEIQRFINPEL